MSHIDPKKPMLPPTICVVIPTYNNRGTILQLVAGVAHYTDHILVVNDGSTDDTLEVLKAIDSLRIIGYPKNIGKGNAIRMGLNWALANGYDYAITIDSDGQHFPDDLPLFAAQVAAQPNALIIGSRNITAKGMPAKNTFANKFSNFWFKLETAIDLPDTQSGFRLYPLKAVAGRHYFTKKYEFELEVLVRAAWRGVPLIPIPVRVYYPPEEERVSHFRPFVDFTRISILNTILVLITLLYIWPRRAFRYIRANKAREILVHQISLHNESPFKAAAGIGFGVFMGMMPIWGFQMITAAFLAHLLKLNKVIVLIFSNISLPPLIPFVIYFSYRMGAVFVNDPRTISAEKLTQLKEQVMHGHFYQTMKSLGYDVFQYVIGSLALGALLGLLLFAVSYIVLRFTLAEKKPLN